MVGNLQNLNHPPSPFYHLIGIYFHHYYLYRYHLDKPLNHLLKTYKANLMSVNLYVPF